MSKDFLSWCENLHPLKGNVSQLQATLGLILTRAPSVEEYSQLQTALNEPLAHEHDPVESRLKTLISLPQVKVAVRLRALYYNGNLPFLLMLMKINFKAAKADKFVGYLLDYKPQATSNSVPDVVSKGVVKKTTKGLEKALASYPPTLPIITKNRLRKRVFTHKSYRQISDFLEADSAEEFAHAHNGKLELQGRSLLDIALLQFLDKKFPKAQPEDLVLIKARLSSLIILTKMAMGYNLSQHLKHNISNELNIEGKMSVLLTVFLAYLGALPMDGYSLSEVCHWVEKLYDPIVSELEPEHTQLARPLALAELEFLLRDDLEFEQVESEPCVVKAKYKGIEVGVGSHTDLQMARIVALENALGNKTLLDKLLALEMDKDVNEKGSVQKEQNGSEDNEFDQNEIFRRLSDHRTPGSPDLEPPYSPQLGEEDDAKHSDNYDPEIASLPNTQDQMPVQSHLPEYTPDIPAQPHPQPQPQPQNSLPSSLPAIPLVAAKSYRSPIVAGQQTFLPDVPHIQPAQNMHTTQSADLALQNTLESTLAANNLTPHYQYEQIGSQTKVTITVNQIVLSQSQDSNKARATRRAVRAALATLNQMVQGS